MSESFLPLIYTPEKSNNVLNKSYEFFEKNPDIKKKYEQLNLAYHSIAMIIPQTVENFWSGHFFPYSESWDELQISFNLVLFGLYKQAFVSLRSGLELGILSVYYNINDEGHKTVQNWLRSKDDKEADTPRANKIWSILNSNKNIYEFNEKYNLRKNFDELIFLHNYVHTKGYKYSNRFGVLKSNFQTFEENLLKKWLETYEKIVILLISLHMLKYPISIIKFDWSTKTGIDHLFPVLREFEIDRIEKILPSQYIKEIQNISNKDPETQDLFNYIYQIPDMTDSEAEEQLLEFDKSFIETGIGFIQWEALQLETIKNHEDNQEIKNKILNRIEILRKWSIDNNLMKSKIERIQEQGFLKSKEKT